MNLEVYQLKSLMKKMDIDDLSILLEDFKCSRSKDSERFLRKSALNHEAKSISRTYLMIDVEGKKIDGYITLAFKCLNVDNPDLDPEVTELMNLKDGIAQAYLVGQVARSDDAVSGLGGQMIDRALDAFTEGNRMFGCRMVRLDCRDELVEYYMTKGFQHIGKNADRDLNQMVTFI